MARTRSRRSSRLAIVGLLGLGTLTACSLLTSLDGLSNGGNGAGGDDGGGDSSVMSLDGAGSGLDGGTSSDGNDGGNVDAALSASDRYAQAVLADRPLGYWRLDETSGTVAKDETGQNAGTYVNAPVLAQPGVAGSHAAKLPNGSDARVAVLTGNFEFTGNAPYSIEIWVRPAVFKDYQWLAATEHNNGGRRGWSLLADANGGIRYEAWNAGDGGDDQTRGVLVNSTPLTLGTFQHVVVAYTGSVVFGYVNGVQTTMFTTSGLVPQGGPLLWGCRGDLAACLDDWVIDEVAIYDFPLKAERVKAHYDLGK